MSLSCVCKSKLSWGIVCLFIFSAGSKTALAASFTGLGDLPVSGFNSLAYGVSFDGKVVVGVGKSASGAEAFRWTSEGGMVGLGDLPGGGFFSEAYGVSSDGKVVVGVGKSASGAEAFRWTSSGMVGLGDLPGGNFFSIANGVSSDGSTVVGWSSSASGSEAFRWTSSGMVGLGVLPGGNFFSIANGVSSDGSVVVGRSSSGPGGEAFRWTSGGGMVGLGYLAGGSHSSFAYDVSSDGLVIVGFSISASGVEAFRWTSGSGMVGLGDLPGGSLDSRAWGVSPDGSVVVGIGSTALGFEAFIWDQTNSIRNLREVLTNDHSLDLTGWNLTIAYDISADGQTIVGLGNNPDGFNEAWVATLAETVESFEKEITSGPDVDGDGEIDVVVEVGKSETTVYDFTITQTGLGGQLIVDTVPAEWVVTQVAGHPIVNGSSGGPQSDGSGGTVEVFPAGQGNPVCPVVGDLNGDCIVDEEDLLLFVGQWLDPNCSGFGCADLTGGGGVNVADYVLLADNWNWNKSATKIDWRPASDSSSLLVIAETRQSPGIKNTMFAPTSCGTLFLNEDGAEAFEVDENGDPLRDPNTGRKLPSLVLTNPLLLVAVEDLNGNGIVGDGSGDEDGDGVSDLAEAFEFGTDPCNPDTDGDGVSDGVDPDPLDPGVF